MSGDIASEGSRRAVADSQGMKSSRMRIVHLNAHGHHGGAARAALRINRALRALGGESRLLAPCINRTEPGVEAAAWPPTAWHLRIRLALDQIPRWSVFNFSTTQFTTGLAPRPGAARLYERSADLIHLHWIGKGTLPLRELAKLHRPLVWTLHDMWPLTGGCHYDDGCGRFLTGCGFCPILRSRRGHDLSSRIFTAKAKAYAGLDLTFVAPSRWLGKLAREAPLTHSHPVWVIPNPLDREVFAPRDWAAARARLGLDADTAVVAFLAMGGATEPRKGFDLLCAALDRLAADRENALMRICVLVIGGSISTLTATGFETRAVGHLSRDEDIAMALAAADVLVAPSRQDNLPNTVMEALACGVPCVAFDVGGLPDLIEHQVNGYLAKPFDTDDLARGIGWVLASPERHAALSAAARESTSRFDPQTVAGQYLSLYQEILDRHRAPTTK